jgi:hypothetical protein
VKNTEFTHLEVVRLKEMAKARRKWWADYPFLISLLAFILSLLTSLISAYTSYRKDIHDQMSELAGAIRTIQELNLKQVEIREKYKGTPDEQRTGGLINNQLHSTVILASDIALRIGTNAITPAIIPLSQRLYDYGEYLRAEDLARLALDAARTIEDEAGALRWLATLKVREGSDTSISEGGQLFTRAFNIDQKYNLTRSPDLVAWIKASVQVEWANALVKHRCNDARLHFSEALRILNSSSTQHADLDRLRSNVKGQMTAGIGGVGSCIPTGDERQP